MLSTLIIVAVLVLGYLWYMAMIRRRNGAESALSSIDVQLRKRHDLLPNVLKLADRFMSHERDLISRVTDDCVDPKNERSQKRRRPWFHVAIACLLSFTLAGCDDSSSDTSADATSTDSAMFDSSLADKPCKIIPPEIVAQAFDVPQDKIEQSHVDFVSSQCSYDLEGDGDTLAVTLRADVYDTKEKAEKDFRSSTRSMSADEISAAMAAINNQAKKSGKLDTDAKRDAAAKVGKDVARRGIRFEDVEGVADQARFQVNDGTLYVQRGNLRFALTAYHGPDMPLPEKLTGESMLKAGRAWLRQTMPERKRQAVKLAKVIVEALGP